jgi:hypothetical protein
MCYILREIAASAVYKRSPLVDAMKFKLFELIVAEAQDKVSSRLAVLISRSSVKPIQLTADPPIGLEIQMERTTPPVVVARVSEGAEDPEIEDVSKGVARAP